MAQVTVFAIILFINRSRGGTEMLRRVCLPAASTRLIVTIF